MGVHLGGLDLDPLSTNFKMRYYCNHNIIYIYCFLDCKMFFFPHDVELTYFWSRFGFLHLFRCPRFARLACVWHDGPCKAKRRFLWSFKKGGLRESFFFWVSNIDWGLEYAYKYAMYRIYIYYIYRYKSISHMYCTVCDIKVNTVIRLYTLYMLSCILFLYIILHCMHARVALLLFSNIIHHVCCVVTGAYKHWWRNCGQGGGCQYAC